MPATPTLYLSEYTNFKEEHIKNCLPPQKQERTQKIWQALVEFATQKANEKFLKFEYPRTLATQNYVGLIQVKGFCVEILPKICGYNLLEGHISNCKKQITKLNRSKFQAQVKAFVNAEPISTDSKEPSCSICHAKQVLYNCLATLKKPPFIKNQFSHVSNANLPLLDIFAQMFLRECQQLIGRGLKRDYLSVSKNRSFLKGKLEFANHLKNNIIHEERFYTKSDEYILDVAPNRLLKSTLNRLRTLSLSPKTQEKLNAVYFVFDEINPSKDIDADFAKSAHATRFREYKNLLAWCDLFLRRKSLAPYSGKSKAYALLFPMEELFESFVGVWLQRSLKDYHVGLQQQNIKHLARDKNFRNCFELRPDIVLTNQEQVLILDTKWKLIKGQKKVSREDLYQMWAYASKYASIELKDKKRVVSVWLVYPWQEPRICATWTFKASEAFGSPIDLKVDYFPLGNL
ncbi:McrC family protein [Helicobacter bizzozeronii]|uniref:McrC family protein n=1 Tax=Helicobacter bizzozeronii TaxID=56877 RepID=UPI000CF11416|nr:McrC family protein [Helicobacter bizzozeronii]